MFFSVGKTADTRFTKHQPLGSWVFSHDPGWTAQAPGWRKGYNHSDIDHGNFCQVNCIDDCVHITHDAYRSFPLWWDKDNFRITNLLGQGQRIWANESIVLSATGPTISKVDIYGQIEQSTLSLTQVVDRLEQNLTNKIFALDRDYTSSNKKLFVSGGTDTSLLLAMVRSIQTNVDLLRHVELLDYDHIEYDSFMDLNYMDLREAYWSYAQIHHWRSKTILLTGGCGDEFLFRGPYTIALWAAWHDIDLIALLDKSSGYHVGYFKQEKNIKVFKDAWNNKDKIKQQHPTHSDLVKQILDINANDHQHWHLGNTLTWTPFKDLTITKLILQLDEKDIIDQILDASISCKLIERFDPWCLNLLSPTKNQNPRQNLYQLFGHN